MRPDTIWKDRRMIQVVLVFSVAKLKALALDFEHWSR
jgi:hypothetical protein